MTRKEIKPGISIRHIDEYEDEGEYLVMSDIDPETMHVSCVMACWEKNPGLNGQRCSLDVWSIENHFEIVK